MTTTKTNILGKIIEVEEHGQGGTTVKYTYNEAGDLTKIQKGTITSEMLYNTLGQQYELLYPDLGHYKFYYDVNGNLEKKAFLESRLSDTETEWQSYSYDNLNRVLTKKYYPSNNNDHDVSYCYDNDIIDNGIGRLDYQKNDVTSYQVRAYDSTGRVKEYKKK